MKVKLLKKIRKRFIIIYDYRLSKTASNDCWYVFDKKNNTGVIQRFDFIGHCLNKLFGWDKSQYLQTKQFKNKSIRESRKELNNIIKNNNIFKNEQQKLQK